jgi:hypothetical protein
MKAHGVTIFLRFECDQEIPGRRLLHSGVMKSLPEDREDGFIASDREGNELESFSASRPE